MTPVYWIDSSKASEGQMARLRAGDGSVLTELPAGAHGVMLLPTERVVPWIPESKWLDVVGGDDI